MLVFENSYEAEQEKEVVAEHEDHHVGFECASTVDVDDRQ